ncbi:MAG TPA: ribosome silencing factor [Cytophagaceae bacterium]|nr:ribosome silencing factor [Cytophagaceae bacterium]
MINKKEKLSSKPVKAQKKATEINLVDLVVNGMLEKKGHNITILDLRNIKTAVADYFVLCSANTDTQLDAIRTSVEEEVYKTIGQDVWMKEGLQNREWILLDYGDVVAHIFRTDRREFYGLEDLWGDAVITVIDDDTAERTIKPKKEPKVKAETKDKKEKKSKAKPNVTVARTKSKTTSAKKTATKKPAAKKTVAKKTTSAKKKTK